MTKRAIFWAIAVTLLAVWGCAAYAGMRKGVPAEVTIQVVDDVGVPVTDALAGGGFFSLTVSSYADDLFQKRTDTNGVINVKGRAYRTMDWRVRKDGYYEASGTMGFPEIQGLDFVEWPRDWAKKMPPVSYPKEIRTNCAIVLRRIRNPIPLFAHAKIVEVKIPSTNDWYGYDLEKADWVAPAGRGVVSDFVFRLEGSFQDPRHFTSTLHLSFSNPLDGIQSFAESPGSALKSDYVAPTDGYQSEWSKRNNRNSSSIDHTEDGPQWNYYFRVRTQTNEEGRIVSALYGKIYESIDFVYGRAGTNSPLQFLYYLNPTPNDRNVEYDPKRNLFTDQKITKWGYAP